MVGVALNYRDMGISGITLGISGGENSVDKNKSANNLSSKPSSFAVSWPNGVGSAAEHFVLSFFKCLHHPSAAYGSQTLHYHVKHSSDKRQLSSQQQSECHRWVNMTPFTHPLNYHKLNFYAYKFFKLMLGV